MKPVYPLFPVFKALCCKCGRETDSTVAATGDEPFTFVCWGCQNDATREAVRLTFDAAFRKATPALRHNLRVQLYGAKETRAIEAREGWAP